MRGGRGWGETEVSQVTSRGLAWWRPLRWPPEWQLRSCRDGLCQPHKRHRRKRRFGAQPRQRRSELRGDTRLEAPSVCASALRAEGDDRRLVREESRVRGTCPGQSTGNCSPGVSSSFPDHELCLQVSHSTPQLHPDHPGHPVPPVLTFKVPLLFPPTSTLILLPRENCHKQKGKEISGGHTVASTYLLHQNNSTSSTHLTFQHFLPSPAYSLHHLLNPL